MHLVAYLRISTVTQADGYGLDVQEEAIRAWARKHGHRLVATETDVGRSGTDDVLHRPGLSTALGRIAAGEATGLVVYKLDRVARDVILQETLLADLHRNGYTLHSTFAAEDEVLIHDPNDPTRDLIRRILGAVAAYERDVINLRLRSGRARKKAIGGYYGGRPPYGWRAEGRELVLVPEEQRAMRRMAEMRSGGATLNAIGDQLSREGLHPRRGAIWGANTIRRVLARMDIESPGASKKAIERGSEMAS